MDLTLCPIPMISLRCFRMSLTKDLGDFPSRKALWNKRAASSRAPPNRCGEVGGHASFHMCTLIHTTRWITNHSQVVWSHIRIEKKNSQTCTEYPPKRDKSIVLMHGAIHGGNNTREGFTFQLHSLECRTCTKTSKWRKRPAKSTNVLA